MKEIIVFLLLTASLDANALTASEAQLMADKKNNREIITKSSLMRDIERAAKEGKYSHELYGRTCSPFESLQRLGFVLFHNCCGPEGQGSCIIKWGDR